MSQGTECLFCKIVRKEIKSTVVYEDDEVIAFDDLRPQGPVHTLVIPKRHIDRISDFSEYDDALIAKLVRTANKVAERRGVSKSGYRLIMNCNEDAGQAVFHVHIHIIGGRKLSWPPG